jgi:Domain of unknown function (DUF4123)
MSQYVNQIREQISTDQRVQGKWFALLDASQIPLKEQAVWAEFVSDWRNLLDDSPEGEHPDLTAWLFNASDKTLDLTLQLSIDYPHSITWFYSDWPMSQIHSYWRALSHIHLPERRRGLCRFYDACVLLQLKTVLTAHQWRAVTAPVQQWLYIHPDGTLRCIDVAPSFAKDRGSITLIKSQLDQLEKTNRPHWLIAQLMANEYVDMSYANFALYQRVNRSVLMMEQAGLNKPDQQYIFCAMTLDWPDEQIFSEGTQSNLLSVKNKKIDLIDIFD